MIENLTNLKMRFGKLIIYGVAALVAALTIWAVIKGDEYYRLYRMRKNAEQVRQIESALQSIEADVESKIRLESALGTLEKMNPSDLSNDQMRRRQILIGDINLYFYSKQQDNPEYEQFFDIAAKAYDTAIEYAKGPGTQQAKTEIIRRIATIYVDSGEYQQALKLIRENDNPQMLPADRWHLRMLEAESLKHTGNSYLAVQRLQSVADETDDRKLWGKALCEKADILVDALSNDSVSRNLQTKNETEVLSVNVASDTAVNKFMQDALYDYQKIIDRLPAAEVESAKAKLGLLKIATFRKDKRIAYDVVNTIQSSPASVQEKAEAMVLLAKMHESIGETDKAIRILDAICMNYPFSALFVPVSQKLYTLYCDSRNWENAFGVVERIFMRSADTPTLSKLTENLMPRNSGIIQALADSERRTGYLERMHNMFARIRSSQPDAWNKIKYQASFLEALLLEKIEKYEEAERLVASLYPIPFQSKNIGDEIMNLDMVLALKSGKDPSILLLRSMRYLDTYPTGKYYLDALLNMLDAYCLLGFYETALETARKIYIDLMRQDINTHNPAWLRVVAKIGESYDKLGNFDMANRILKENARTLLDLETNPDVFLTWSNSALEQGQIFEALRRLDVVIPRINDIRDKAKLIVARYLLQLRAGNLRDYRETRLLLERIAESRKLPVDQQEKLKRALQKGLLEFAFKIGIPDTSLLVEQAIETFPKESWTRYWALKDVFREYENGDLEELGKRYADILSGGMNLAAEDRDTAEFLKKQIGLIRELVKIDKQAELFKNKRGLENE